MIEIAVVGNKATEQWLVRQEAKLHAENLQCRFVPAITALPDERNPDLWLIDVDGLAPGGLANIGDLVGHRPWVAMAKAFSLETTRAAVDRHAFRCIGKPVTPRVLREVIRELGIGTAVPHAMVTVVENRETVVWRIEEALSGSGLTTERLDDVRSGLLALRKDPPDAIVLSHYPDDLPFRSVINLIRVFPELSRVPVFVLKGSRRQGELLEALNGLPDLVFVAGMGLLVAN